MKRLIISTLIAITSTVALAATIPNTKPSPDQTLPWTLRAAGETWKIANPQGTTHISFTVAQFISANVHSDPVKLICDTTQIVAAGKTGTCTITGFKQASFAISIFKNGSQGTYTVTN